MSLIGDISDPKKDAAALQPVLDELEEQAIDAVIAKVIPALQDALTNALDGLMITVTISRREKTHENNTPIGN